jgi:hypothetical protein
MMTQEAYQACRAHMYHYVKLTTGDGSRHKGYILNVDGENVTVAVPNTETEAGLGVNINDQRGFPFLLLTIPLAYLAGVATARPKYPYPPYYPYTPYPPTTYPSTVYPSYPSTPYYR